MNKIWMFALLAVGCSMVAFSGLALAQSTPSARNTSVDDGVLVVSWEKVRLEGDPPRLELCLKIKEILGFVSNEYRCESYGSPADYLEARFPGKQVRLTRWDYVCTPMTVGGIVAQTCKQQIIMYYKIGDSRSL